MAAPTGKAAARLRQSIDFSLQELNTRLGDELDLGSLTQRMGAARTLHSLLGARVDTREFRFNATNLLDVDILIVDEASMIHLEMMSALLQALPQGAKLILLGDKDQLASVEAGAVLGDLCRNAVDGNYNAETARFAKATACQLLPKEFITSASLPTPLAQQTVMLRKSRRFGGLMGLARRDIDRHTYADYISWPDDARYELIDGIAYGMSPAPTRRHQEVVGEMFRQIANTLKGSPCQPYIAPFDVRLPNANEANEADSDIDTVVQPDISVICDKSKLDDRGCCGAPDWVIEVLSPATASHDQIVKRTLYERVGVRE